MPSFEWNKIIASVLTAMIVAMVVGILASQLVHPRHLEKAVYLPPGAEGGAATAAAPAAPKVEPIGPFLAKADPKKGEQTAKVCLQCHTFAKGQPNKIGPNLYGVMDEKIAAVPGYQFSPALSAHKDEKWDPQKLNIWLDKPQDFAKGTKMTFPGMPKEQDRADVIAYLLTNAPDGDQLLKDAKEKAAAEAKQPAGGAGAAPPKPGEKPGEKAAEKPAGGGNAAPAKPEEKAAEKPAGGAGAAPGKEGEKPAGGAPAAAPAADGTPASPGASK
jgi:cytochrome c